MSASAAVPRWCGRAISPMATSTSMAPTEPDPGADQDGCWGTDTPQPAVSVPIITVVAVALLDVDNRILLAQRPPGKSMAGLWEFPGGKINPGETPEAALIRELDEELGLETWGSCLAPAGFASEALGERLLILLLYVCRKWRGLPRALHGEELRWVRPLELHG